MGREDLVVDLIDDMGGAIASTLKDQLAGIYISERNLSSYFINNLGNQHFIEKYNDLVLIDATYENKELGVSALDIAEKIRELNPNVNLSVLLGADINSYMQQAASYGDYDAKVFLARVRALPHVIYGERNNKLDTITSLIFSHAKKTGYKVERRLPHGEVSEEILSSAKERLDFLRNVKNVVKSSSSAIFNLQQPKTEEERVLVNLLKDSDDLCGQFSHDLSNILLVLSHRVKRANNVNSSASNETSNSKNEQLP